jgi:flagellar biosynthesis protein FliQ
VVALVLVMMGPGMVGQLTDFTRYVFEAASQAGR